MDAFLAELSASQYDELLAFFQLEAEDMRKANQAPPEAPRRRQAEWA